MSKKTKLILLVIAGILLLFFLIIKLASHLASDKLSEVLNKKAKDYHIDFEQVDVSVLTQSVDISEIIIKPLNGNKTGVQSEINRFGISGVDLWDLLLNDKLVLSDLVVLKANTTVTLVKDESNNEEKPLNKFLKEVFSRVVVENIRLEDCSLRFYENEDSLPKIDVEQYSLTFDKIVLDTITVKKILPFSVSSINGFIGKSKFKLDSLYNLHFTNLKVSNSSLFIDSLKINTELSQSEFQRKMPIEKDWIYFLASSIELTNYNWKTDSVQFYFNAEKMCLKDINLLAYRDKNLPFGPETQKPMPSEMIRKIPFNLNLDTVQVKKGSIEYQEKPEGKQQKGSVYFTNVYASIYNICNDSVQLQKNPWLVLDAKATFNHCGKLDTHWEFKIPDYQDHFKVRGSLGEMEMKCVNKTFKPMLDVEAEGTVHQIKFNFNGDYANSKGEVYFDYEGLKVQFYDEEKEFKNWLKSTVGNVAMRTNNLPSNSNYQKGEIDFDRVKHKSIFNYLWKSLQNGLLPVVLPFKGDKIEKKSN